MRDIGFITKIGIIVFAIECAIMFSLPHVPEAVNNFLESEPWLLPLLDTSLLVALSSPLIYVWVIHPFVVAVRETEFQLERNNDILREAQQISQIGSWELDLVTDRLSWSHETYRIFGIEEGGFSGCQKEFLKLIHPEDVQRMKETFGQALKTRSSYLCEHRIFAPGGKTKWVESRSQTEYSPQGAPLKSIGTVQNITARKQAEFDIRDLRASLNLMDEAVIMAWRDSHRVFYSNRNAKKLLGWGKKDPQNRSISAAFSELGGGSFAAFVAQHATKSKKKKNKMSWHCEIDDPAGHNIEITVQLLVPDFGEARYVLTARDISERNAALRAKTEFLSTISHELRTPLTAIRGTLALLNSGVSGVLPKKSTALVEIADRNSQALASLVEDLLSSEQMKTGKMTYDMQATEISELIPEALLKLRGFADKRTISLNYSPPEAQDLFVMGDSFRLGQVITNLVSNAIKFSKSGHSVDVSLDRGSDGKIRIYVRDTGSGIPLKAEKNLFERFSQGDSSDTRRQGGTGLGLHISKKIIDAHAGTIGFSSKLGEGSTFWIELDLLERMQRNSASGTAA